MNNFARELENMMKPKKVHSALEMKRIKQARNLILNAELEQFAKELERELAPPFPVRTLPSTKILWHTRGNKPIEESPDYLYTSLQPQQSILHGISQEYSPMVLYKLKPMRPLKLLEFKTPADQKRFARIYEIKLRKRKLLPTLKYKFVYRTFKPFTWDDVKIIKYICKKLDFDGYIARWDQDQVTLCMGRVKFGRDLKVLKKYNWKVSKIKESDVTFKRGFYRTSIGKGFIKKTFQ